ncbi:hypothetical protein FrEUN1fDRAFT_8121, partial [Parafrankia sp. EUN1f]
RGIIDSHCATPYEAQLPPNAPRQMVAVAGRWGLQVLIVDAGGGGMCRAYTETGAENDVAPDFAGLNGPLLWSPGQHDLSRPPANPVEVFSSGEDGSGRLGEWNARRWAVGQVAPEVALLVAALPTGEAVIVPFEPSTGAFITHIQVTTPDVAQYHAVNQMPLTLYAYDSAGTLVAQTTAAMCAQYPACNGPEAAKTIRPSPLTSAPMTNTGIPTARRTPTAS